MRREERDERDERDDGAKVRAHWPSLQHVHVLRIPSRVRTHCRALRGVPWLLPRFSPQSTFSRLPYADTVATRQERHRYPATSYPAACRPPRQRLRSSRPVLTYPARRRPVGLRQPIYEIASTLPY